MYDLNEDEQGGYEACEVYPPEGMYEESRIISNGNKKVDLWKEV